MGGVFGGVRGGSWGALGSHCGHKRHWEALGRDLGRLGAVLELSWGHPEAILGLSWALVGLPGAPLWASCSPLGALLGSSWAF